MINNYSIYVQDKGNYVFWKSNNYLVEIHSKPEESFNFPIDIIEAYLTVYPPEELGKITEEKEYKFDNPPDLFNKWNSYDTTTYFCPEELTIEGIKTKISGRELDYLSVYDFEEMLDQCKEGSMFVVHAKEIEAWLKDCMIDLAELLDNNNIEILNNFDEYMIEECYIRDYFEERYNPNTIEDYNDAYFYALFDKRNQYFVDFMRNEYEERMTKTPATPEEDEDEGEGEVEIVETAQEKELKEKTIAKKLEPEEGLHEEKETEPEQDAQQVIIQESEIVKEKPKESIFTKIVSFFKRLFS